MKRFRKHRWTLKTNVLQMQPPTGKLIIICTNQKHFRLSCTDMIEASWSNHIVYQPFHSYSFKFVHGFSCNIIIIIYYTYFNCKVIILCTNHFTVILSNYSMACKAQFISFTVFFFSLLYKYCVCTNTFALFPPYFLTSVLPLVNIEWAREQHHDLESLLSRWMFSDELTSCDFWPNLITLFLCFASNTR